MPADGVAERYAAEAEAVTRRAARTFHLASRLLPRAVRRDVLLLYLVLRTLDDAVDEGLADAPAQLDAVERWLDGGEPETREAAVLADLDARHGLPRGALRAFLQGMRDDLAPPRIATEADLDLYCYRVAGSVGELMTAILGVSRDDAWGAARGLGLAMQRTNVLRDVDEDLANGRVYLAAETLARFGVDDLRTADRSALYRDQIARADALYEQGLAGVDALVHGGRAIAAAGRMYREILRQIEREGYGARAGRAVVAPRRKLAVAGRAALIG